MTGNKNEIYPKKTGAELNAEIVSQPGVSTDINREYKDRLFKFLFGNPEHKDWTLSLYNAVNGTFYEDPDDISFTTINDTVYMSMKNDVSFLIANTMNFYEQQSTMCSIPCRMIL